MRLGLRGRFVLFVSAMIVAFGVILTALAVREQSERLRHELEERGKLLATVVGANTTDALALLDIRELRLLIAEARVQENVVDVIAFDEHGRVLTDGTVKNLRRHELIPEAARRHAGVSEGLLVEFDGDSMTVTRPVFLGSEPLGGVLLRYSMASLAEDQVSLARRTAAVGAVFALLGVLAAALLTEAITRPLKEVIDATRAVTDGESAPRLTVRTSDEVGELAESFNEMTRMLRDTTVSRDFLDRVVDTMGECLVVTGLCPEQPRRLAAAIFILYPSTSVWIMLLLSMISYFPIEEQISFFGGFFLGRLGGIFNGFSTIFYDP